jgi:hypothetical protein
MTDTQEAHRRDERVDDIWQDIHDGKLVVVARAERLLDKFNYDPADALAAGEGAYVTFCRCWELVYPTEYIQRVQRARQDGGVRFNFISMED